MTNQLHLVLLLCSLGHLLLPAGAQPTTTRELYVKPTENTSCPEPCHILDEYVQNASRYFVSNTTFNFLPGNHSLTQPLGVSGVINLALVAINGTVDIMCYKSSFSFKEISNLTIEGVTLFSCYSLVLNDLLNLSLLRVSIRGPLACLVTTNLLGTSIVTDFSTPTSNCYSKVIYNDQTFWPLSAHNQLMVKDSAFWVLNIHFEQTHYWVNLIIDNFINTGTDYRVIPVLSFYQNFATSNSITLTNLHIMDPVLFHTISFFGTGFSEELQTSLYIRNCYTSLSLGFMLSGSMQALIEDSYFTNVPGTVFLAKNVGKSTFLLRNVTFSNLHVLSECSQDFSPTGFIFLENVTQFEFTDCRFVRSMTGLCILGGPSAVVQLLYSNNVTFTNCTFSDNEGTSIVSVDSTLTLSGSNSFQSNRANKGGAMALYGRSYVTMANDSIIQFVNNSAVAVGGGIYIETYDETSIPCFFQFQSEYFCHATAALPVKLSFDNNSAGDGGDSVYGASFDTCIVGTYPGFTCGGWTLVSSVLHINDSILSAVSSDPLRVCLCDTQKRSSLCTTVFENRTVYPGETFSISAVVVGDRFGTVDGSVYAQILPLGSTGQVAELEPLQLSQRVKHDSCNNISYTILSNSSTITLVLTASSTPIRQYPSPAAILYIDNDIHDFEKHGKIGFFLRSFPIYINITLLPCPLGFMLSGEPYQCVCDTQLQNNHIPCNLTTQTVQRSGTTWVNASFHNNTPNGVIVDNYCPNNYCKLERVNISLEHPDAQCAFNHSGILCGGCQSGLSLTLGSAQCRSCSNDYLALLLPFALAGVVLVAFIKLLNLTVAKGTMNGLIFYANIVRANQVAWIPGHDTNILTVFIAWINLDLGIETCFVDGLDAYWKTWLQFVFPFYIWAIVLLIIILSRHSLTAAKIFGSNSAPILATLFLLSYSKLLRTIISIFQFSTLDYPDGTSATVWSYDGNVPYFNAKRFSLMVVALIVIVFLWLPYTGVLLFIQCLQRSASNYTVAALLMKFKPFFDAYFGPLKDNHRYWVGLLLLVRGVLFVVYASTPASLSGIGLLATAVAMLCLLVYPPVGYVYQKTYLNLLENFFLLNTGVLAVGTFYIQVSGGSQAALAYTSVGIAFALFVLIVFFHALVSLRTSRWTTILGNRFLKVRNSQQANQNQRDYERLPARLDAKRRSMSEVRVSYSSEYREPVMSFLEDH